MLALAAIVLHLEPQYISTAQQETGLPETTHVGKVGVLTCLQACRCTGLDSIPSRRAPIFQNPSSERQNGTISNLNFLYALLG